jgi:hypothetical protein
MDHAFGIKIEVYLKIKILNYLKVKSRTFSKRERERSKNLRVGIETRNNPHDLLFRKNLLPVLRSMI